MPIAIIHRLLGRATKAYNPAPGARLSGPPLGRVRVSTNPTAPLPAASAKTGVKPTLSAELLGNRGGDGVHREVGRAVIPDGLGQFLGGARAMVIIIPAVKMRTRAAPLHKSTRRNQSGAYAIDRQQSPEQKPKT